MLYKLKINTAENLSNQNISDTCMQLKSLTIAEVYSTGLIEVQIYTSLLLSLYVT